MSAAGRSGEHGIALLLVLLTITLLTIVVVEFTQSAQVETHFALSGRNAVQAFYLARSGINVAEALLGYDARLESIAGKHADGLDPRFDVWARPLPPIPIGDGTAMLRVQDEGRRLNLNAMRKRGYVLRARRLVFERLFTILRIDRRILAAIVDWVDSDRDAGITPIGAESTYYLGLRPPVRMRDGTGGFLLTVRELLQVRGMTPAIFAQLEPFVTALPVAAEEQNDLKVNVNTAPPEVLYALSQGLMTETGVVDRLVGARRDHPFTDPKQINDDVPGWDQALGGGETDTRGDAGGGNELDPHSGAKDYVDVKSTFFRIDAVGQVNDVVRGVTTLVRRESGVRGIVRRVTWEPSTVDLSLTSQPASDFLDALPPLGGGTS